MSKPRKSTLFAELRDVCIAYSISIAGLAAIISIPFGIPAFPLLLGVAFLYSLPALGVALILFAVFREKIWRRPNLWCGFAPFIAGAIFVLPLAIDGLFHQTGWSWFTAMDFQSAFWAAFGCASVAAIIFRMKTFEA